MINKRIVAINNILRQLRKREVAPENVLLLFPHCLQWSGCPQNIIQSLDNCKRCGKCDIGELLGLAQRRGVQYCVASGGRQAVAMVRRKDVKVVIAVACHKELAAGILAALPKPVIAIPNMQPCGPCKDTKVDMTAVDAALAKVMALSRKLKAEG